MAKVDWPAEDKRALIGKRISRVDSPLKTTGTAKYSFDINRPGMLWATFGAHSASHLDKTLLFWSSRCADFLSYCSCVYCCLWL